MSTALAPVDMTKIRDDPYVHFGDVLQLVHVKTGCLLAVDVEDKVSSLGCCHRLMVYSSDGNEADLLLNLLLQTQWCSDSGESQIQLPQEPQSLVPWHLHPLQLQLRQGASGTKQLPSGHVGQASRYSLLATRNDCEALAEEEGRHNQIDLSGVIVAITHPDFNLLQDPRPGEQTCAGAGSAAILDPVARNTFLISKHVPNQPTPLEPQWEGDVLRYAQKIRLLANPMAQV